MQHEEEFSELKLAEDELVQVNILADVHFLTHLFPDLSTLSRTDPFHFQAGGCRRQPTWLF